MNKLKNFSSQRKTSCDVTRCSSIHCDVIVKRCFGGWPQTSHAPTSLMLQFVVTWCSAWPRCWTRDYNQPIKR